MDGGVHRELRLASVVNEGKSYIGHWKMHTWQTTDPVLGKIGVTLTLPICGPHPVTENGVARVQAR